MVLLIAIVAPFVGNVWESRFTSSLPHSIAVPRVVLTVSLTKLLSETHDIQNDRPHNIRLGNFNLFWARFSFYVDLHFLGCVVYSY